MPFDYKLIEDALNSNVDAKEVEAFAAESDPVVKDALSSGVPLAEVINYYKSQGGEQNADQTSTSPEGTRIGGDAQDGAASQVEAGSPQGVQARGVLPAEDQGQLRGDDQTRVTNERQTQDAQGGIQGQEAGQGMEGQVPARVEAEVIPQQAAMKAAPFGAESVPPATAKSFAEKAFEGIRDFGAEALSSIGQSLYGAGAGIFRQEPEYLDMPSLGVKVKNPRYEENKKIVDWFEGQKEKAGWVEEIGAEPVTGITKTAADVTGGLLKIPAQLATGPLGFASMIGEGFGATKEAAYQKAIESGASEEDAINKANLDATATTAAALPLYFLGGKIAGEATDKLISKTAPELAKIATRFGLNAVANSVASSAVRGVEAAMSGESITDAMKDVSVPGVLQDIAFAAHSSVVHFKEQAAKGNGAAAARDLPDPILEQVAKDPQYTEIVTPEISARIDNRVAQQAKNESLPETAQALEAVASGERIMAEDAGIKPITLEPIAEEAPKVESVEAAEEKPAEVPAEAQPTKPSEEQAPAAEAAKPEAAVKAEEVAAQREGEAEKVDQLPDFSRLKDIESRKALLSEEQLKEANRFEELRYKKVALGPKYKPYKLSKSEKAEYKYLFEKYKKLFFEPPSQETRVYSAAYRAPNGVVYEGKSHLEAMEKAKEDGAITQEEIDAKQDAASRNTDEFGYNVILPDGTKQATTREAGGQIAKQSGQALKEEFDFGDKMHSNEVALDIEKPAAPEAKAEPTFIQKAESWADSVIKESAKRVSTGLDPEVLAAYAVKGSIVIGRGVRNFGVWSGEMVKQFGEDIRPHLKDIWSKAKSYAGDEEVLKSDVDKFVSSSEKVMEGAKESPRATMKRIAELKQTPEVQAAKIQASEFYDKKTIPHEAAHEWVESIPEEFREVVFDDIMSSLGRNEAADSMRVALGMRIYSDKIAAGDFDGATQILNRVAPDLSIAGRMLNYMKEFYKGSPEGYVRLIEKMASMRGVELKPVVKAKTKRLAEYYIRLRATHEDFANSIFENANTKQQYKKLLKELKISGDRAVEARKNLDRYIDSIFPKEFQDVYKSLIQLNLLTPMSIANNLFGNLSRVLVDMPSMLVGSYINKTGTMLLGKDRSLVFGPTEIYQYLKTLAKHSPGVVKNTLKALIGRDIDINSSDAKIEIRNALYPKNAIKRLVSLNKNRLYEGAYTFGNRAADLMEGIFGIPASFSGEMLAVTDAPYRESSRRAAASSIARQIGVKGLDYIKFLDFPEAGIRKYAKEKAANPTEKINIQKQLLDSLKKETARGVFEQENIVAAQISEWQRGLDKVPVVGIISRATVPYVRIPANVTEEIMRYTILPYSMARMFSAAKRGDTREASILFGQITIGAVTALAAGYLYKQGIVTPPYDPKSKESELGFLQMAGSSINWSGLKRLLNGENPALRSGDKVSRLDKVGILGGIMMVGALRQKKKDEQELLRGKQGVAEMTALEIGTTLPKVLAYSLNSSFMKGVNSFLLSLSSGNEDKWAQSIFSSASAAFLPATLSSINRSIRTYMPDETDDTFYEKLKNVIKDRVMIGKSDETPRVDLFGRPVKQTPEGADPILYNFVDIGKTRNIPNDPVASEMVHLYHITGSEDVIPARPQNSYTYKNTTYSLTPEENFRYQTLIGEERYNRLKKLVDSSTYIQASDEKRVKSFTKKINAATSLAKKKFEREIISSGGFKGDVKKLSLKEKAARTREMLKERSAMSSLDQEDVEEQ